MRIRQAMFGACVAAALVFGAGAGPAKQVPAASGPHFWTASIHAVRDRVLSATLDVAGEIEARARHF